jgi:hypothetical protein
MADEKTYLIRVAAWLGKAIGDTSPLFADFSSDQLGLWLPDAVMQASVVSSALKKAEVTAAKVRDCAIDLESVATSGSELDILAEFLKLGSALTEFFVALSDLADKVETQITPANVPDAAARADAQAFAAVLAKKLGDWAIASAITERVPEIAYGLKLAGLLEWTNIPRGAGLTRGHVRKGLRLDRIKGLITDPAQHFKDSIGWGRADFDPTDFFRIAREFFDPEDDIEVGVKNGDPFIHGCVEVRRDSSVSPPGIKLVLLADYTADFEERRAINDEWGVGVRSNLRLSGGVTGSLTPPMTLKLRQSGGEITGELSTFVDRNEEARPFDVIGGTGLLSLSANNITAGLGMKAQWNVADNAAIIDPLLFAEIDGLTLKLGTSDADSFIGSLLAAAEIKGEFNLALEWQASTGLRVRASGGIEIALPIHKELGPIELQTIYLALRIKDDGSFALEASAALGGNLGPISATIERIGAQLDFLFIDDVSAKFGPFDTNLGFKPPNGVGLAIDAGIVKGGGYLYFDFDREEYAGALELVFSEWIALKAIGLITTKMPDGSKGFSLLIIITVEFGTGIQLGFGFTLLGVGGILGLHRIVKIEPLKDGIRTGAIESVMFPEDVVANAPRIISDLRKFFPPQQDIFLVGPLAKLGWGTPTLLSAQLGVILEFPSVNITILGVIKVILPDEKADILRLQVNFIGRLEPSNKLLWFYAELFDSRVLFLTIEGGFGLLLNWGDNANFVVSVGGFHPRYNPPPLPFPEPPRIAVNILNESWARVRIEGYFAVTSNSVQFGARAELYFGLSVFRIEGHLAFDALFQFNPFFFSFSLSFSLSVKVFGIGLWSVGFSGLLEGPTPWHIKGKGSISLLFFSISVPFEHTWGDRKDTKLDPIEVYPLLEKEFKALTNWEARIPDSSNLLVSLRKLGEGASDQLVLHPVGKLRISPRKVPVNFKLDKMGNQRPSDYNKFSVDAVLSGGGNLSVSDTEEKFAIGQFKDLDASKQMSSPAFEPLDSGIDIGVAGEQMKTSRAVRRVIRYETNIIDNNYKSYVITFFNFFAAGYAVLNDFLFRHFLKGSAVSKSVLSKQHKKRMQPFDEVIQIKPNQYSVVYNTDNKPMDAGSTQFASQAKALAYMEEQIQNDSTLANRLHVIPNTELNVAA